MVVDSGGDHRQVHRIGAQAAPDPGQSGLLSPPGLQLTDHGPGLGDVPRRRAPGAAVDYLITSGGVGPTHDDVTLQAVAEAFERPLVRSPELVGKIREMVGERCTEGHLRMADVPEGAELVSTPDVPWPSVVMENVYVLPGVPRIFRMKLPMLRARLAAGRRFYCRAVYTSCRETDIAELLDRVVDAHDDVDIGSYPVMDGDYRVKLTVDSRSRSAADLALAALVEALPAGAVVRVDGGVRATR